MSSDVGEKARAVFLAALMVLSVVAMTTAFAGSAAAAAHIVTVDDDGPSDYDSVQAAVDAEGSDIIIEVADGTYDETVTFDGSESNVTIEASDPANPPEITGGISIKSSVSDLTIENVELSGVAAADRTFQVAGGSLEDVTFDGVTFEGDDTVNSAIYGNAFTGNVTLTDVTVANYTVDDWRFININTQSTINNVDITGSTFQNSTGMIAFGEISNNVTIEDNTFSGIDQDTKETAVAALALGDPALGNNLTASISGNTFSDNFNHVVLGDVDGETIQSVVNSNNFDRAVSDDRIISPSIQNVVDSADSGDTVSVGPGTYEESIVIDGTNNLTLQGVEGANGNSPVIVGDGANIGAQPHATIHVKGDGPTQDTTIEGFTIRNPVGNYGVYAGEGGSDSDVDGFVLRNNTIEDIATNTSGHNPLAGSVSGLYVRAEYDSITVEDNTIRNVNTTGDKFQNAVGLSFSSFIGNAAFADTDAGSETAENTSVQNNVVTNISGAEGSRTKGISVSGEFDGLTITNNTVTDVSANTTDSNILAITLTENPGGSGTDIDDDGTNERIGPRNFEIRDNDIDELSGADEALVFVGGYEDLGDNRVVEDNNFLDTDAGVSRFAQNQSGFNPGDEDTLDATSNWWGDASGPSDVGPGTGASVSDTVDYAPWLDAPAPDGDVSPGDVTERDVTVGATETVNIPIDNYPSGSSANFTVTAPDGTQVSSGSTNDAPVTFTADFTQNGNYTLNLFFGGDGNISATAVTSTFDANATLDPAEPSFNEDLTVTGEIRTADGSGAGNKTVEFVDPTDTAQSSSTSVSTGAFSVGSVTDDAGEWSLDIEGFETQTITVEPQEANLSVEANNTATFEQTSNVTIELTDASGDPIDTTNNINGYINVTGPFTTAPQNINSDGDSVRQANTEYVRVETNSSGVATFNATPNGTELTATLENTAGAETVEGLEDTSTISNDAPDYVADAQTVDVQQLNTLNVDTRDEIDVDTSEQDLIVTVTGDDGQGPSGQDGDTSLVNATVSISGPNVDNETTINSTSDATFPVLPDEGGTITAEVTAINRSGGDNVEVGPQTVNVTVNGDQFENLAPSTDPNIDATTDVGVDVTNADGTGLNNRNATFVHSASDGFNVTDADGNAQTGSVLRVSGSAGAVLVGSDTSSLTQVEDLGSVNNGEYLASDVSFDATGTVNLTVNQSGTPRVYVEDAFSVTGVEVYDLESDTSPALVGTDEVHNLTVTENGEVVNGTALNDLEVTEISQAGDTDNVAVVTAASPADTDDDGTNDALQVELRAENATEPLNISISETNAARSGSTSIDVVQPDVSTSLGGDALTLGLNSTDVEITAEDPRDGEALADADLQFTATNATFDIAGDSQAPISDTGTSTLTLDENGTATVSIAPNASNTGDEPISLGLAVQNNGSNYYGDTTVDVGTVTIADAPDQLPPESEESLVLEVTDANGEGVDLVGLEISGSGIESQTGFTQVTDEGFADFDVTTTGGGTISLALVETANTEVDVVADGNRFTANEIDVFEQVNLTVTANQTDIDQGDSVQFNLTREDFNQQTTGNLTITNASGAVVDTVAIDQTTTVTFDEAGDFTVEASKPARPQVGTNFVNDSVDVSVAAPNFTLELVDGPTTITQNEPYSATVNVTNNGDADGSQTIEYELNGTAVNTSEDVSLNASESTEVTFDVAANTTADIATGNFTHEISSDDDEVTLDVEVIAEDDEVPATFDVSGLQPQDATVNVGEEFTVTATIENTGDLQGEQDIELLTEPEDGSVLATEENVSLDGGNSTTVAFENISVDTAGEYNHTVASEDDSATGSLTVEETGEATGSVTFDDQTVTNGTEEVTVANANYTLADGTAGDYVVVVHVVNDDGSISDPVGYSSNQTGEPDNPITVDLNASGVQNDELDRITENVTLRAMLHETAPDSPFGPSLGLATDDADITVGAEDAPANFEVSGLQPQDATVNASEAFDVSATVENTGDLQGEQDIELRLEPEGDAVLNETVSLDAGNSTTVTFEDVTVDTAGEYNHTVASANDSATGSLTVEEADLFPEPLPGAGAENPPQDLDNDGLYEDVDGNGEANFDDAVALAFVNTDGLTSQQIAALDFDGDGDVDFDDAVELAFLV